MIVKRRRGQLVHWAPSSEIFFVQPGEAQYIDPSLRMNSIHVGDQLHFTSSPDAVTVPTRNTNNWVGSAHALSAMDQKLRIQVAMNKHGLIELNLASLELSSVPAETFNFSRIEVLNVSKNKLSAVPAAIGHLRKLRTFDAHHNHIHSLPDTVANCCHLQEVDLSNNRLSSLPAQFGLLRQLRILKLGHNRFESIPHAVGDLVSLRQLDLPGNKLWHLPGSVGNLHNLHLVNLGHNMFESLPIAICQLRHLEAIDLRDNRLLSLPVDCEQWTELKELNVSSNRFETVPHCISNLRNLQSLDLSHNKLKVLPPRLAHLTRLRYLMACDNQIVIVPNNLEALEYLNLAENRLKNFSVSKMRRLTHLNANQNALENLPLGVCNLGQIEVLKLNTNRISYVSQDIVLLKNLRTLDLGHNKLTSLPHVINEMENLETFNVQGNSLDTRYSYPQRDLGYLPQNFMFPAQMGRQEHLRMQPQPDNRHGHNTHPMYDKKKRNNTPTTGTPKKKNRSTQYQPHTRSTGTEYIGHPGAKVRERPPLDYVPQPQSLPPSYPHSKRSAPSERPEKAAAEAASTLPGASLPRSDHKPPPSRSLTEKSHTGRVTHEKAARSSQGLSNGNVNTYTKRWLEGKRNPGGTGNRSNAATVNDSVGDELSLGDEDYDFQPTTVKDHRLLDVCKEVEDMLNKQMLQPWVKPKSIFKKSVNEQGTMRMLNGLRTDHQKSRTYEVNPETGTHTSQHGVLHVQEVSVGRAPDPAHSTILLRTKADQFDVTPAGGLFKSSVDPNVSVYFPVKAIEAPMTITLQLEKIDQEALLLAKRSDQIVNNILAMGHVVHVTQSENVDFNDQVTLKIPTPPAPKRGKVHILTYHDDNTCSPCDSAYKVYQGYISLQVWHFSGKGAVLTKSKCKYKACKSVEQLLSKLYV